MTEIPTETELLARALFRGFLQLAKSIAAIYGWSIKDENDQLLREQLPHEPRPTLNAGGIHVVRKIKIE